MARKGYEEHYSSRWAQNRQLMITLKVILLILSPILFLKVMAIILGAIEHHKIGEDFSILLYVITLILVWFRM